MPFLDLSPQTSAVRPALDRAIAAVIDSSRFLHGEAVDRFERAFAAYLGVAAAVGVGSGTDALCLALEALDVGPGDVVLVPANTFIATCAAVTHAGAQPMLMDCGTAPTVTASGLERALSEAAAGGRRVRAAIVVHLYGLPAEMEAILEVARAHDVIVVEDCAQAHGAWLGDRRVGAFGRAACFSFYPSKNLGAFGDGGAVVTSDRELAEQVRRLSNHGQARRYDHQRVGYSSRLDELQAAVLDVKLHHLEAWNAERRALAACYDEGLADVPDIATPAVPPNVEHAFHLYVVEVGGGRRDALAAALRSEGVETLIHYPLPVHLHPAYRHLGYGRGDFPHAERAADRVLSLPLYPGMAADQVDHVIAAVARFMTTATGP